jgi:ABC-type transport system involved in cytochrome bd biosynthesis fused ATPase/permease subunit
MSERRWAIAGKILTALAVLSAILIGIAVVAMLRTGVSARTGPTRPESMVARTMRHFAVPAAARSMRNPVPLAPAVTPQELEEMKRLNLVSHEEAQEKEFLEEGHETH